MPISMSFPDAIKKSDHTFHMQRHLTYTLKFSEKLNGQYNLVLVRKHYPRVPLSACPFHLPTLPEGFKFVEVTHDNVTHLGVTFVANNCTALSSRSNPRQRYPPRSHICRQQLHRLGYQFWRNKLNVVGKGSTDEVAF